MSAISRGPGSVTLVLGPLKSEVHAHYSDHKGLKRIQCGSANEARRMAQTIYDLFQFCVRQDGLEGKSSPLTPSFEEVAA